MSTIDTTIADKVDAIRRHTAEHLPANVRAALEAEEAELNAEGVPDGVPAAGAAMPDGALLDVHGEPTSLEKMRGGKPAVVVFYRGAWCPYCNVTLRSYQEAVVPELDAAGVALIAISPQKPDGSLSMQEKNELTFSVVSDPGNQIAGHLGILTRPIDGAREAQASLGLDISEHNADGTHTIPMPTVVIVDALGTIRWIDVHPAYTSRTEPAQILEAVALTGVRDASEVVQ
jgi:peroxiredoxin